MSNIIKLDSPTKERTILLRYCALALRALSEQKSMNDEVIKIYIFFGDVLHKINQNVEKTCAAWEKRDYWMKADKFRLEWEWANRNAAQIQGFVKEQQWEFLPNVISGLIPFLIHVKIPQKMIKEKPWIK